jgi:hypothetical protein
VKRTTTDKFNSNERSTPIKTTTTKGSTLRRSQTSSTLLSRTLSGKEDMMALAKADAEIQQLTGMTPMERAMAIRKKDESKMTPIEQTKMLLQKANKKIQELKTKENMIKTNISSMKKVVNQLKEQCNEV